MTLAALLLAAVGARSAPVARPPRLAEIRAPLAAAPVRGGPLREDWSAAALTSPVDGAPLGLATRGPHGPDAPVLYVGGLAMADSLRPLADARPGEAQAYLRLRGHPPSGWTRGTPVFDADARDLARAIQRTAEAFDSGRVSLALHSYAGLAFQRMVSLERAGDPDARRALRLLGGARVALITTASRRAGDSWGRDYESGRAVLSAVAADIDAGDALWSAAPPPARWAWEQTRTLAVAGAVAGIRDGLGRHFRSGWRSAPKGLRRRLLEISADNAKSPEWLEGILRRAVAVASLDFAAEDAARLRALGVGVLAVLAADDQLLDWPVSRLLLKNLGLDAPRTRPSPGTRIEDPGAPIAAVIVDGDHYLPVKDPAAVSRVLDDAHRRTRRAR